MRLIVLSSTLAVVAACHGGDAPPDADEGLACMTAMRGDIYTVGLERSGAGGALDFKLMTATPSPPAFNDNTWVIQINTMTSGVVGNPATGASLIVTPFMPDHQHGTLKVNVEAMPDPGQYKLTPINMWMPGLWETTIEAQAGAVSDRVVYKFCIQA
jgi:YtkA-like